MTDITLEQRAALDSLREALPPPPKPGTHETITIGSTHLLTIHAALVELEEALRLSAEEEWVLVPREPTEAMRTAHAMYGDTSDWWQAVIAAAPRHEPGEG